MDYFQAAPLLEGILQELADIDVVVSSSWREVHTLSQLRDFFSEGFGERIIDVTPVRPANNEIPGELWSFVREAECAVWMQRNRPGAPWLAIDDDAWRFAPNSPHVMLVDGVSGLSAETVPELRRRLQALART
jgi:hypothetical protein